MDYTQQEVYSYILDKVDKKGSDFFQLPHVLKVFRSMTHDFLDEHVKILEETQKVTQDLQFLMLTIKQNVVDDSDNPYIVNAAKPNNCYHLAVVKPIYFGGGVPRQVKMVRHGNMIAMNSDPHNRPTRDYPLITQHSDYVTIDSGYTEKAEACYITFIKHPIFAGLTETTKKIVDFPENVIDKIIEKVCFELISSKGDERSEISHTKSEAFGKAGI